MSATAQAALIRIDRLHTARLLSAARRSEPVVAPTRPYGMALAFVAMQWSLVTCLASACGAL